jgi:hypothetical protein
MPERPVSDHRQVDASLPIWPGELDER